MTSDLRLITSESVTEGHPDKVADQISDAVLDAILADDPEGRVACETLVTTGMALVAGEVTTRTYVDIPKLVRKTLEDIGYTRSEYGIDADTCAVLTTIDRQAPEIAERVNFGGAGDQGIMFGYACDETPERMPLPIATAHALVLRLAEVRKTGEVPWLRPDGKSQVTFEYDGTTPVRINTVVLSAQHDSDVGQEHIKEELIARVIAPVVPPDYFDPDHITYHINPSGSFSRGGPHADAGLTGRKIIVDTYGGVGRHGGGAFSGKDATKVDRSGAYAARWAAKNLVATGLAKRAEVQLAYAIGVAEPVQVYVDAFGTSPFSNQQLARAVGGVFDFRPLSIIERLGLRAPIYLGTAAYGHFGRTPDVVDYCDRNTEYPSFAWERIDRTEELRDALAV